MFFRVHGDVTGTREQLNCTQSMQNIFRLFFAKVKQAIWENSYFLFSRVLAQGLRPASELSILSPTLWHASWIPLWVSEFQLTGLCSMLFFNVLWLYFEKLVESCLWRYISGLFWWWVVVKIKFQTWGDVEIYSNPLKLNVALKCKQTQCCRFSRPPKTGVPGINAESVHLVVRLWSTIPA